MAGLSVQVVAIKNQEGDNVLVSIPMRGFPDGFQLSAGDQVVLLQGDKGVEARPLTHVRRLHQPPKQSGKALTAASQEFAVQDATANVQAPPEAPDNQTIIFTVPNEGGRPEQVLSIRSPRR
jgi:copper(I)-binding protein